MNIVDLKVGDVITYNDGSQRQISFTENTTIDIDKIIKIERPDYKTIFEKKDILDKEEKEYLSAVIKPFRNKVLGISKTRGIFEEKEESIVIALKTGENIPFPYFKTNTMYKKMELSRLYTLEELGL